MLFCSLSVFSCVQQTEVAACVLSTAILIL